MRKAPVRYAVTAALAALTAAGHLWLHGWSRTLPAEERYRILCDAFTVPGLMLVLIAALVALSNEGSFDALGYAVRYTVRRLIPGAGLRQETYGEFVERHREQGRVKGYGFLLHVGLVFLCTAGVFLYLYFKTA